MALLRGGASAADSPTEYQVKAAFLLNFTKFVDWPAGEFAAPESPLNICIEGGDPFGTFLDQIVAGEAVDGHKLVVSRVTRHPSTACQVIFISSAEKDRAALVQALGPGVLTVSDGEDFSRDGGIVAFVIDNRRVRFDINQSAAEKAGLKISSKLLTVARSVAR